MLPKCYQAPFWVLTTCYQTVTKLLTTSAPDGTKIRKSRGVGVGTRGDVVRIIRRDAVRPHSPTHEPRIHTPTDFIIHALGGRGSDGSGDGSPVSGRRRSDDRADGGQTARAGEGLSNCRRVAPHRDVGGWGVSSTLAVRQCFAQVQFVHHCMEAPCPILPQR